MGSPIVDGILMVALITSMVVLWVIVGGLALDVAGVLDTFAQADDCR